MISITCTKCQALLTMDDAFAGAVCRCQYCGTIQTVPAQLGASSTAHQKTVKTLYQKKTPAGGAPSTGQSSGLDELAQSVGGASGLGRGAAPTKLADGQQAGSAPADEKALRAAPILPILIGLGLLLLIGLGVAVFFFARSHGGAAVGGPHFAGVALNAKSVIYLLDNGNSNDTLFDPLKAACYKSLDSLGSERKFQVMLWDNKLDTTAYPSDGLHSATTTEIAACRKALADTVATGNSHLSGPLKKAVAEHPDAIVIATAKWDLDREDRDALAEAQGAGIKLYTFGLGAAPESGDLKLAASASAGQFKHLSASDLNLASE